MDAKYRPAARGYRGPPPSPSRRGNLPPHRVRTRTLIGIVDTTFARIDMGDVVESTLRALPGWRFETARRTVPGVKDLAVEAKILIEEDGASIVLACGWVGGADIDLQSAHEASLGLMAAQLMTNTHILQVFVHEREKVDPLELAHLCEERCRKHALNAVDLVVDPQRLAARAGRGIRQGDEDVGPLGLAST